MGRKKNRSLRTTRDNQHRKKPSDGVKWAVRMKQRLEEIADDERKDV